MADEARRQVLGQLGDAVLVFQWDAAGPSMVMTGTLEFGIRGVK